MPAIWRISETYHPFPLLSCKGHWIISLVHLCSQGGDKFQRYWCRAPKSLHLPLQRLTPHSSYHIRPTQCAHPWTSLPKPNTYPACTPGVHSPQRRNLQAEARKYKQGQGKKAGAPGDLTHRAQQVREGYCMMLNTAHAGWGRPKGSVGICHFFPEEGGITGQGSPLLSPACSQQQRPWHNPRAARGP